MNSDKTLVNQNTKSSLQSQNVYTSNQSTVILQQFSMITWELQSFTDNVWWYSQNHPSVHSSTEQYQ